MSAIVEADGCLVALLASTGTIVWATDAYGRFLGPNGPWSDYTGHDDADALGHGWRAAVHVDDQDALELALRPAEPAVGARELVVRIWHAASASWRWVRLRWVADDAEGFVGTMDDVDDERRASERQLAAMEERGRRALDAAEARLALALDSMRDAVAVASAVRDGDGDVIDFRIHLVNPAAADRAGHRADELIGHRAMEVWPALPPEVFDAAVKVVDTGGTITVLAESDTERSGWYDATGTRIDKDTILVVWRVDGLAPGRPG